MKAIAKFLILVVCACILIGCQTTQTHRSAGLTPSSLNGDLSVVPRETNLIAPDVRTFLITAGSQPTNPRSSLKIEPWLAAGITNLDRSHEFLKRLHQATAGSNLVAQAISATSFSLPLRHPRPPTMTLTKCWRAPRARVSSPR
jgi:hypothetical protein